MRNMLNVILLMTILVSAQYSSTALHRIGITESDMDKDTSDAAFIMGSRMLQHAINTRSRATETNDTADLIARSKKYFQEAADYYYMCLLKIQPNSINTLDQIFMQLVTSYREMGYPEGIFLRIGKDYVRQGNLLLARNMATTALKLNRSNSDAHLLLAFTYDTDKVCINI